MYLQSTRTEDRHSARMRRTSVISLPVTLEDIAKGATKEVRLTRLVLCRACKVASSCCPQFASNARCRGRKRPSRRMLQSVPAVRCSEGKHFVGSLPSQGRYLRLTNFNGRIRISPCDACKGQGVTVLKPCTTCTGTARCVYAAYPSQGRGRFDETMCCA